MKKTHREKARKERKKTKNWRKRRKKRTERKREKRRIIIKKVTIGIYYSVHFLPIPSLHHMLFGVSKDIIHAHIFFRPRHAGVATFIVPKCGSDVLPQPDRIWGRIILLTSSRRLFLVCTIPRGKWGVLEEMMRAFLLEMAGKLLKKMSPRLWPQVREIELMGRKSDKNNRPSASLPLPPISRPQRGMAQGKYSNVMFRHAEKTRKCPGVAEYAVCSEEKRK